jgi:hypothetical protein
MDQTVGFLKNDIETGTATIQPAGKRTRTNPSTPHAGVIAGAGLYEVWY